MGFKSKADRFITDVPADFIAATGGHEQVHPEASFVTEEAAMEVAIEEDAEKNVSGRVVKYLFMTKKFFKMWWRHSLFLSQFRSHSGSGFASSAKMNSNTSTVARSWGLRLLGMLIWVCSPAVYFVEFVIVTVSVISSFCTVVRDSASYIKWVSSHDNPLKNVRVLRIVLDRGGEASLMGYMSFTFFRCAQFMGQVATDFTRVGVVSCWLVVFLFVLVPTNKTSTKEWLKAIITAIAIIVGGYMSLDIRYNNLHDVTFLGLPAKYDFNRMDISLLAPILYGMMHNCLLMWCFLPLTMCRALLTWIMDIPYHGEWISKLLGIHDMYYQHRMIGYTFLVGLTTSACIWWFILYRFCAEGSRDACLAFYPDGIYVDIRGPPWFCTKDTLELGDLIRGHKTMYRQNFPYDECVFQEDGNPNAVIFLREAVVVGMIMLVITAEFKYPVLNLFKPNLRPAAPITAEDAAQLGFVDRCTAACDQAMVSFWDNWIAKNQFELFMYTHVLMAYTVAIAALFSRWEVFFPSAFCWCLYALDRIYVMIYEQKFYFSQKSSADYVGAYKLTLKKRHGVEWQSKAGQIVFVQCPELGELWLGRQWHAFSLASSNCENVEETHDRIELLIQSQGKGSWTEKLKRLAFGRDGEQKIRFNIRGPFGSSFQDFKSADFVMLIGGGSGVAGSLSVLREMVINRGEIKRCWFIYATRSFASVQWCWSALEEILRPTDPSRKPPRGFLRLSIHVSARLTPVQSAFIETQQELKGVFRSGRPNWLKIFRSFGSQNLGGKGVKKTKVCACANKAIYADIDRAIVSLNDPTLDIEFSSENFE